MATLKRLSRKKGEAYLICFIHPKTKKRIRKVVWCARKDAERIVKKIESDIALGQFSIKLDSVFEFSWEQLKKKYLAYSRQNKSIKTTKREQFALKAFDSFLDGNQVLNDLSAKVVEQYRDTRLSHGIKPATVSIELRILKTVFNMAMEWEMVSKNPLLKVKVPKPDIINVRFLRVDEISRLIEVTGNDRHFQRLVIAYLNTGARRIELLPPYFTWNNVNFQDSKVVLEGLKGTSRRYVPMNKTVYDLLNEAKQEGLDYPFEFQPDYVTHKIAAYYKLAGIKGATLHSLRKTFGSMLLQSRSADLYMVSKLLGHASVKTTEKYYVDLLDENYRRPLDSLDTVFKGS